MWICTPNRYCQIAHHRVVPADTPTSNVGGWMPLHSFAIKHIITILTCQSDRWKKLVYFLDRFYFIVEIEQLFTYLGAFWMSPLNCLSTNIEGGSSWHWSGLRSLGQRKSWDLAFNGKECTLNPRGRGLEQWEVKTIRNTESRFWSSLLTLFSSYETFNTL